MRSKGKIARSLGTKSRHAGGTNGDVFRLSTWYGRTAAVVSWLKNRSPRWFYCRRCLSSAGAAWQDGSRGDVTEESVDMLMVSMTMFGVCPCGIPGWQRRSRGGCVGRYAGGTDDDDGGGGGGDVVAEESVDALVLLSAMFVVCRRSMVRRQRRCRGRCVGRHAGGTEDDVSSLSAQHTRTAVAVSQRKSRSRRRWNCRRCLPSVDAVCKNVGGGVVAEKSMTR